MKQISRKKWRHQQGVGLIEVLIAALIMGTALLTLTSLQSKSLQFNQSAYLRSQANILAYDIIDRIRANQIDTNNYDITFSGTAPTGTSVREKDVAAWLNDLARVLPQGDGQLACDGNLLCKVEVRWNEQSSGIDNSDKTVSLSYTVQL